MPVDNASFRQAMGHFATGVALVTSKLDGEPCAMTANSLTSVSLDPPLVLFCAEVGSITLRGIEQSGFFAVNILSDTQERVSRKFALPGPKEFATLVWRSGATGAPLLEDCLAWLDCRVVGNHDGGDHRILVGRVEDTGTVRQEPPLLYYRGGYHSLDL